MIKMYQPLKQSTIVSNDGYEWRPKTFSDFLEELEHLRKLIPDICYFRGQKRSDRLLDSRFARNMKLKRGLKEIERYSHSLQTSVDFQHELADELLEYLKSVPLLKPLFSDSPTILYFKGYPIDLLYQYHVHIQQNPDDRNLADYTTLGSNFLDFSLNWKIGLFFANRRRENSDEGAIFVVHQRALGEVLHIRDTPFQDILIALRAFVEKSSGQEYPGEPLLPWPKVLINNTLDPKPKLQEAIYLAQMDFRHDLELRWKQLYQETQKQVYVKVMVPVNTSDEVNEYLVREGLTENSLFPATKFDKVVKF